MPNYCINCGVPLDLDDDCPVCGHKATQRKRETHQCEYTHKNKQCPATATALASSPGQGVWLCSAHYRNKHRKQESINILESYLKNGIPQKKDWRDELLELRMAMINGNKHETTWRDELEKMRNAIANGNKQNVKNEGLNDDNIGNVA